MRGRKRHSGDCIEPLRTSREGLFVRLQADEEEEEAQLSERYADDAARTPRFVPGWPMR